MRRPYLRCSLSATSAVPGIPHRRHRKRVIRYDKKRYRIHRLMENAFCHLWDFRRTAHAPTSLQLTSSQPWHSLLPSHSVFE